MRAMRSPVLPFGLCLAVPRTFKVGQLNSTNFLTFPRKTMDSVSKIIMSGAVMG